MKDGIKVILWAAAVLTALEVGGFIYKWLKIRCSDSSQEELGLFARDLFDEGVYVLPCGGGIMCNARRAFSHIRWTYGRERLIRLSTAVALNPYARDDSYPEGIQAVAYDMLYLLADKPLLEKLICFHRTFVAELSTSSSPVAQPRPYIATTKSSDVLRRLDRLIAGICNKLNQPCPEGIRPLDRETEASLFRGL